jgi:hypothetical protein
VLAQSTGKPLKLIPDAQLKATHREWMQVLEFQATKHFEALMRVNGL